MTAFIIKEGGLNFINPLLIEFTTLLKLQNLFKSSNILGKNKGTITKKINSQYFKNKAKYIN